MKALKKNETRSEIVQLTVSTNNADVLKNNRTVRLLSETGTTGYRLNTLVRNWNYELLEVLEDKTKVPKINFIFADGCVGFLLITINDPP